MAPRGTRGGSDRGGRTPFRMRPRAVALLLLGSIAATPAAATPPCEVTARASESSTGVESNVESGSLGFSISGDGRYVAFTSAGDTLVAGDTNGVTDVFVHDRIFSTTTRASVGNGGVEGTREAKSPALNWDGRFVGFASSAPNLIVGDTNGLRDVFVRDTVLQTTERVSIATDGTQGNASSGAPSLSADGRYVAFESAATTLVANDTNGALDVFVRDRQSGVTTRVSVASSGAQGGGSSLTPVISADGRFVAFESFSSNLVPNDTNGSVDVFVHDRQTGTTTRVSVATGGVQATADSFSPSISADGGVVGFASSATNLVVGDTNGSQDIFVHNRATGTTERVSVDSVGTQANGGSSSPSLSAHGRFVVFDSSATMLVADDTNFLNDVFVRDRLNGLTRRLSVAQGGAEANSWTFQPRLAAGATRAALRSNATNLVPSDTNQVPDVFTASNCLSDCTLAVTAPGWGSTWTTGTTVLVQWSGGTATGGTVILTLHRGPELVEVIGAAAAAAGQYSWDIPLSLPPASDYVVAIEDASAPECIAFSDGPVEVTSTAPVIAWTVAPPPWALGGDPISLEWLLLNFTGPITENQAHFGIRSVLGSSDAKAGTGGPHTHAFTAPNVGTFDSPTTYAYIIRALDNGTQRLSSAKFTEVSAGATPPTVTWVIPPPASAFGGGHFNVEWQLADYVSPATTNAVGWGVTTLTGQTADQAGGSGLYTADVTVPWIAANQTMYYTAFASNPIEFAFAPVLPVTLQVQPLTLAPSAPSPGQVGTPVTITAAGGVGKGPHEYRFFLFGPGTGYTWVTKQAYGVGTAWTWTPIAADTGSSTIRVWVRKVGSVAAWEGYGDVVYVINP